MIGKVVKVNYRRGLVIFEDDIGDYGYFEVLGSDDFKPDEIIIGNLHSLGGETIIKQSTKEKVDICIEDYGMSYKIAMEMVFRK
ncbi:MAG: hypothetical protein IJY23_04775 [Clostridia bacterium]|nr:hypothetical protein [Clostridia bacterium]